MYILPLTHILFVSLKYRLYISNEPKNNSQTTHLPPFTKRCSEFNGQIVFLYVQVVASLY